MAGRWQKRSGQALVELVVALVALIVIAAGLIQVSLLGVLRTRAMTEARREAGVKAMMDASSFAGPDYIADVEVGDDQTGYSRDDETSSGNVASFQAGVVRYSRPDDLGQLVSDNAFSALYNSSFPQLQFGLVDGESQESMELLPVIRTLLYQANEVEVEGKAWLTWTKGVY